MEYTDPSLTLALIGFAVGILVGMTGTGGGALTTPLLIFWVGIRPIVAVGSGLLFLAILKGIGAWTHHQWGNIDWRLVRLLALGGVPGALLGILLLLELQTFSSESATDAFIERTVGVVLIITAVAIAARFLIGERMASRFAFVGGIWDREPSVVFPVALGFITGVLVSLTSVGGGTLVVAFLAIFYRISGRRIVGTDIAQALILTSVASFGHIGVRSVDFILAGNLLVGAIPGLLVGGKILNYMPDRGLRAVLASVLLAAGVRML